MLQIGIHVMMAGGLILTVWALKGYMDRSAARVKALESYIKELEAWHNLRSMGYSPLQPKPVKP